MFNALPNMGHAELIRYLELVKPETRLTKNTSVEIDNRSAAITVIHYGYRIAVIDPHYIEIWALDWTLRSTASTLTTILRQNGIPSKVTVFAGRLYLNGSPFRAASFLI